MLIGQGNADRRTIQNRLEALGRSPQLRFRLLALADVFGDIDTRSQKTGKYSALTLRCGRLEYPSVLSVSALQPVES